jgi:hypothetical protein
MEEVYSRLGQYLYEQTPLPTGSTGESWEHLPSDVQAGFAATAHGVLDRVLTELIQLAERPPDLLRDVAQAAAYWLIEVRDQHHLRTGSLDLKLDEDMTSPYEFGLDPS